MNNWFNLKICSWSECLSTTEHLLLDQVLQRFLIGDSFAAMFVAVVSEVEFKIFVHLPSWSHTSFEIDVHEMDLTSICHSDDSEGSEIGVLFLTNSRINANRSARKFFELGYRKRSVFKKALLKVSIFIINFNHGHKLHIKEMPFSESLEGELLFLIRFSRHVVIPEHVSIRIDSAENYRKPLRSFA